MKALIAVSSKHGSTLELARAIAAVLDERGISTTLLPSGKVTSLAGFDAVVLGSGIYANKMLPSMMALGYRWGDQLSGRPVYLFASGPLDASSLAEAPLPHDARRLARQTGARKTRLFGGRLRDAGLSTRERALMRMSGVAPGDYRDWDAVASWAAEVADDVLGVGLNSVG
ncbi:MAG: flavodoxin domain-containing protein [Bifidobacteriaceae bacterium]|jgi:menaquinone-dependent protoporphyrinogen oxidase|nr:flavodoxin domain-containing protein [Bifidobacteriaceae bacterium]